MKHSQVILIVLLSMLVATNAKSQTLMTCVTQTMSFCEGGQCRQIQNPNKSWVDLEPDKMRRCDNKGCDTHETDTARSGEYLNISIGNKGYLLKIDGNGRFVEVATLGLTTIVKNGKCS